MSIRTCKNCSKTFKTWPYVVRDGRGKYCSRICSWQKTPDAVHQYALRNRPILVQPDGYRLIPLNSGLMVKIDIEDYGWVSKYVWHAGGPADSLYPCRNKKDGAEYRLHRAITSKVIGRPLAKTEYVDHANRDAFDARRSNLRLCELWQNSSNMALTVRNTSGYKGVAWEAQTRKWKASITVQRSAITIGRFTTSIEAAYVRNQRAQQLHGEFAFLNVL